MFELVELDRVRISSIVEFDRVSYHLLVIATLYEAI